MLSTLVYQAGGAVDFTITIPLYPDRLTNTLSATLVSHPAGPLGVGTHTKITAHWLLSSSMLTEISGYAGSAIITSLLG